MVLQTIYMHLLVIIISPLRFFSMLIATHIFKFRHFAISPFHHFVLALPQK